MKVKPKFNELELLIHDDEEYLKHILGNLKVILEIRYIIIMQLKIPIGSNKVMKCHILTIGLFLLLYFYCF
jgi:hypothetical protein